MKVNATDRSRPLSRIAAILAAVVLCAFAQLHAGAVQAADASRIAFKLDPRLTAGLYMGERWVSPTTFVQVQSGDQLVVAARSAESVAWVPADSAMVSVEPGYGDSVAITINRAGETVLSAGFATLVIKARETVGGILSVEIAQ